MRYLPGLFIALSLLAIALLRTSAHSNKHHGKPTPAPAPAPATLTLAWDAVPATADPATNPVGYRIWEGFGPRQETVLVDVKTATVWTLSLTRGSTYYFVVTAYNAAGTNSPPSNEVAVTP
jgi:hypothetical protein